MEFIGLDFETYSAADLPKVGLHNYVQDPTFRPLIAAVALEKGVEITIDFAYNMHGLGPLRELLDGQYIAAHNAGFEQAVLRRMGIDLPSSRFIDTAVLARCEGFGSSLEAAAPQLLGVNKMAEGRDLIKLFSIPGEYQDEDNLEFDPDIVAAHPWDWSEFRKYCLLDAQLSWQIASQLLTGKDRELEYAAITLDMNNEGWPVDLDLVKEMKLRYEENTHSILETFKLLNNADDLNLRSYPQLLEWCEDRGVKAKSFDEKNVAKLIRKLEKKLGIGGGTGIGPGSQRDGYEQVLNMLRTKQELGGSSLKKLDTLLNQVGEDGRLYDAYLHVGASATRRTTGRGVQMQNLKRLMGEGDDVSELDDPQVVWSNAQLARNLRQVFCAGHRDGRLIVGDFASVESRGLAWQAGEQWKLDSYFAGEDLYKVQAGRIYAKDPGGVTKSERQTGKVGELACGYGAGPEAVRAFAEGMGVELDETDAASLVKNWRTANPEIVKYWAELDTALHRAVASGQEQAVSMWASTVVVTPLPAPYTLRQQTGDKNLRSLWFEMLVNGEVVLSRVLHGVHQDGRQLKYWKSSERKTGDLWNDRFTDPKTGQTRYYSVYGGKMAGLLTQSLCREMFFQALREVRDWVDHHPNLRLIGQFHDEIVLEWEPVPTGIGLDSAIAGLEVLMSKARLPGFPMAAQVHASRRYIK